MSQNNTIKKIEKEISETVTQFKALSEELVACRSIQREEEIRLKMQEYEVKKRVLTRKLKSLQNKNLKEIAS